MFEQSTIQTIRKPKPSQRRTTFFWTRLTRALAQRIRIARQNARRQAEMRQLRSLSQSALRDLGLSRSELGSVASELSGITTQERLRTSE